MASAGKACYSNGATAAFATDSQQNSQEVSVFLCGDVMLGRGVDQILRYVLTFGRNNVIVYIMSVYHL